MTIEDLAVAVNNLVVKVGKGFSVARKETEDLAQTIRGGLRSFDYWQMRGYIIMSFRDMQEVY